MIHNEKVTSLPRDFFLSSDFNQTSTKKKNSFFIERTSMTFFVVTMGKCQLFFMWKGANLGLLGPLGP